MVSSSPRTRIRPPAAEKPTEAGASPSDNAASRAVRLETWRLERFKLPKRTLRKSRKGQAEKLEAAIGRFGFNVPVLCTSDGEVIDGLKRLRAAQALGYESLPVAVVDGLSPHEVEALRISVSKLAELSAWDMDALTDAFKEVLDFDADLLRFTGFETAELDTLLFAKIPADAADEEIRELPETPISRVGDIFDIGPHRLMCGDAKESNNYELLLASCIVQMVLSDVPYGVKISGVCSRSHGEFVEGSNRSDAEMQAFFEAFLSAVDAFIPAGCILDFFIDFRSMCALTLATRSAKLKHLTTCVWDKQTGGMGGTYRNQAEFIHVCRKGETPHIDNVRQGQYGRNRTTIWSYPGYAAFGAERAAALARHPTSKPVGLLADAILDVTHVGGVVLDMFAGSSSTLVAAHRTKRVGMGMELDPRFVDVSLHRLEEAVGVPAIHEGTGLTFAELAVQRSQPAQAE